MVVGGVVGGVSYQNLAHVTAEPSHSITQGNNNKAGGRHGGRSVWANQQQAPLSRDIRCECHKEGNIRSGNKAEGG